MDEYTRTHTHTHFQAYTHTHTHTNLPAYTLFIGAKELKLVHYLCPAVVFIDPTHTFSLFIFLPPSTPLLRPLYIFLTDFAPR